MTELLNKKMKNLLKAKGRKFKEIFHLVNKFNLRKDIIFLGYMPKEILPLFYNVADLFVFPSLYEGFGYAVAEAWFFV